MPSPRDPATMTADDWIHAAQALERGSKAIMEAYPGHHGTYLAQAYAMIAKAYYHADSENQRQMKRDFAPLFARFAP